MNRFLLLLLLAGCATSSPRAFHQAVMRPAPYRPPPAYTPSYAPGTPAEPVYVPVGAGVPGERVPGPVVPAAPAVPRSPNKRVLPRTDEPGVWAADGARGVFVGAEPELFGVNIPFPEDATTEAARDLTRGCIKEMNDAAAASSTRRTISDLPSDVRRCMAMIAYAHCAATRFAVAEQLAKDLVGYNAAYSRHLKSMETHARGLTAMACSGVRLEPGPDAALERVTASWDEMARRP